MGFARYVARRTVIAVVMLFAISIIVFWLFALMPGDYFSSNRQLTPQRLAELRQLYGLDKPVWEQYWTWLTNALHGDFGYSQQYNQPVTETIAPFMWNSFIVAVLAFVLTWALAIGSGVYAATKQYGLFDRAMTWVLYFSLSVPSFFLGMLLIKIFAIDLGWLPTGGKTATGSRSEGISYVLEVFEHMILPVAILTLLSFGSLARYFRSGMLEVLQADFIRTARAKGVTEKIVVFSHGLRNALLPAITLAAMALPGLFSGAIITEQVFNWPGVGAMQLEAVNLRDYQVLMTITLLLAALTIFANLLADVLYAAADPRIRLDEKVRN